MLLRVLGREPRWLNRAPVCCGASRFLLLADCVAKRFYASERARLIQDQAPTRNINSTIQSRRFDCCVFLFYSLSAVTFATQSALSGPSATSAIWSLSGVKPTCAEQSWFVSTRPSRSGRSSILRTKLCGPVAPRRRLCQQILRGAKPVGSRNGIYGTSERGLDHSGLMPPSFTTRPHLAVSDAMKAPYSAESHAHDLGAFRS